MMSLFLTNKFFSGIVVGKLPFEPWKAISVLSHKGLSGEDYREFSLTFLFALS